MARIRTIKPEFWSSEQIVECSPTARLLFVGLWSFCDDGGVIPASIKSIKMQVFPGDSFTPDQINEWMGELIKNELIIVCESGDKQYFQITGWHHQKIEKPSYKYPQFADHSPTIRRTLTDRPPAEVEGKGGRRDIEGKGGELPPPEFGKFSTVMTEKQLREIFEGEIQIEQWCMKTHSDKDQFTNFMNQWVENKVLTGNYHYQKHQLKSFMLADWEKEKKEIAKLPKVNKLKIYVAPPIPAGYEQAK